MQTITVELTGEKALQALKTLEHKHLIRIVNETAFSSYALPGEAINKDDFKRWIEYSEGSPTVSITEAKKRWAAQKKKLQRLTR